MKTRVLFSVFRTITILMQVLKPTVFTGNGSPPLETFQLGRWWKIWASKIGYMNWLKVELSQNKWIFFRIPCLSGLWHTGKIQRFFHAIPFYWWMYFDLNLDERTETFICVEDWFSTSRKFKTICVFWRFFNVKTKKRNVQADLFSIKVCFFDPRQTQIVRKSIPEKLRKSWNFYLYIEKF